MNTSLANAINKSVHATDTEFSFRELGFRETDERPQIPLIPLIVLNHLRGVAEDFDPVFVEGLAARHRVIVFDHRAGLGSYCTDVADFPAMALDAIEFIGARGFKLVDLVGFSIGGEVARHIVQERPDLVRRIILAGAIPARRRPMLKLVRASHSTSKPATQSATT